MPLRSVRLLLPLPRSTWSTPSLKNRTVTPGFVDVAVAPSTAFPTRTSNPAEPSVARSSVSVPAFGNSLILVVLPTPTRYRSSPLPPASWLSTPMPASSRSSPSPPVSVSLPPFPRITTRPVNTPAENTLSPAPPAKMPTSIPSAVSTPYAFSWALESETKSRSSAAASWDVSRTSVSMPPSPRYVSADWPVGATANSPPSVTSRTTIVSSPNPPIAVWPCDPPPAPTTSRSSPSPPSRASASAWPKSSSSPPIPRIVSFPAPPYAASA